MLEKYLVRLHWFLKFVLVLGVIATVWLIVGYLIPSVLPPQEISNSDLSGIIIRSQRWSGEIRVVGDVWALPGTTISISPGTRIIVRGFGDKFNLHFLPWGLKSGLNSDVAKFGVRNGEYFWDESNKIQIRLAKLIAIGTRDQPIILTSSQSPGGSFDFNIFSFHSGIISFMHASNYRQMLLGDETVVRDSQFNNTAECAICLNHVNSTVVNNVFQKSLRQSVLVNGGSPKISDNLFENQLGTALVVDPQKIGKAQIFHNDFEQDSQIALELLTGDEFLGGVVSENNFSGGSIIRLPCNSHQIILQNQIRGFIQLTNIDRCIGKIEIGPNFWNTNNPQTVLNEKILGKPADFKVLIPEVLTIPPESGRRSD